MGNTPNAKALLFPLLITGLMFSIMGGGMMYNNPKRIVEFQEAYEENAIEFIKSEKERTDEFYQLVSKKRGTSWLFWESLVSSVFLFWANTNWQSHWYCFNF